MNLMVAVLWFEKFRKNGTKSVGLVRSKINSLKLVVNDLGALAQLNFVKALRDIFSGVCYTLTMISHLVALITGL